MPQTRSKAAPKRPQSKAKAVTAKATTNRRKPVVNIDKTGDELEEILPEHISARVPVEVWCIIFYFVTEWEEENDTTANSFRALAALGVPVVHGALQVERLRMKKLAYDARLNIQLVCKNWRVASYGFGVYKTVRVKDPVDLRMLMFKFLGWERPKPRGNDEGIQQYSILGRSVTRLELNFDVSKLSTEEIGSTVRGFVRGCNHLTVVDDHTNRTGYKRAPTPIEIELQAAVEVPFAVALGNSQVHSIKYAHFSKDSLASFKLPWVINLLNRLPNLEILSLADYPGWDKIPLLPNAKGSQANGTGQGNRQQHAQRSRVRDESDEDDSDDSGADDEADPLPILAFPNMHTLDISRLPTADIKRSMALSKYLGQWEVASVVNLGLSVYNHEAIPVILLRQFADRLQTMYLHHFTLPRVKPPRNSNTNPPVKTSAELVADKKFDLPELKRLFVVVREVDNWSLVFTCPNVTHYTMSFVSYSPTPFDPRNPVCEFKSNIWESSWKKVTAHLRYCQDTTILPHLQEVSLADNSFRSPHITSSHGKYWRDWEALLKERNVKFVDRDGLTWSQARVGLPSLEELKKMEDNAKAEKELARVKEAEAAKAAQPNATEPSHSVRPNGVVADAAPGSAAAQPSA